ncbi:MAG: SDR family oxidoreductase [Myxococcales bacterium]|nr:MAG: SDR family oxidoreductase [Myxococcales bacterium]
MADNASSKIALVTGANRGIGFEVCKQLGKQGHHVIVGARDEHKGQEAQQALQQEGIEAMHVVLEVTDSQSIRAAAEYLRTKFGRIDVLINNAGVFLDQHEASEEHPASALGTDIDVIRRTLEINTFAPLALCQAFIPGMLEGGYGRVVNVSSGLGQLSEMNGGNPAYRISKTALNAVTKILADELRESSVKVNSVCPGWVQTDMGGPNATRKVQEGASGIVWAATLPDDGPSGGFFRDGKAIAW